MNIISFLKWRWNKWERWQRIWVVGLTFFVASVLTNKNEQISMLLMAVPAGIFIFYTGKWMVWDAIRDSYQEYEQEKKNLVELLKSTEK